MIIVAGSFRIDPAKVDAFMPHARTMLAETRREHGCIVYSYAFDVEDLGLVRIYEEWETRPHLDAHLKTPHIGEWRKALTEIGAHSRNVKVYEAGPGEQV